MIKNVLRYILVVFFLFISSYAYSSDKTYGDISGVIYLHNYDGDTITFNIPSVHPLIGENISIRVYGIDTPEIKGKCEKERKLAIKTKEAVHNLLSGAKGILLKDIRRDKYFRILAVVLADGNNVGDTLILKGLAVPYYGDTKTKNWCE